MDLRRLRLNGCNPKRAEICGPPTSVPNEYSIMDAKSHGGKRFRHPRPACQFAPRLWFHQQHGHRATKPDNNSRRRTNHRGMLYDSMAQRSAAASDSVIAGAVFFSLALTLLYFLARPAAK